jgi:DTW domain-containing protein YfiP
VLDDRCPTCGKPRAICVCDRTVALAVTTRVLVLQHPQEPDQVLGTAPLLAGAVAAKIVVGLSWRSLAHAWGEELDPHRWGVLWRGSTTEAGVFDAKGKPWTERLDGILALDGTWSQAKALWWRNAWMLKCQRVILNPKHPSRYGALRREPRKDGLSTIEAAGILIAALERRPEIAATLNAGFERMLTRFREVQRAMPELAPKPKGRPKRDFRRRKRG